jgi:hypothetical protein
MFKLLREAQALEKLGDKAAFAKQVQQILGVASVITVMEAAPYEVTPEDYQEWLPAIIDIAAERGININKKDPFMDLSHDLLGNDPKLDMIGADQAMRRKIVSALWQMYKVNQAHGDVKTHVAGLVDKAREDEETANGLVGGEGGFEQAFSAAKGVENEEIIKRRRNPYQPGTLRAMLWDEQNKGAEDEEFDDMEDMDGATEEMPPQDVDTDAMSPDDLAAHIQGAEGDQGGEEDLDTRVDDLEARVADLEAGEAGEDHDEFADDDLTNDEMLDDEREANPEMDMPKDEADGDVVDIPMDEDEEKVSVSDLFRKAITSPKEHMSAALKAVEDEGAAAWSAMSVPGNPHPKKTPAHAAWMKGFKNNAKNHLGIVDKPREVTSKHRGKKK